MTRWHVDADITAASTLDKAFYADEAAWALARERVFVRSWQWLGRSDPTAPPGTLAPVELLPGLLDEPLLLARDGEGTLRCLSNVCTHRGLRLVDAPCRTDGIRCGYHGRRFGLDGRVQFMPGFHGVQGFPAPRDDLARPPFGELQGHAFVALAPPAPLAEVFAPITQRLAWLPWGDWPHDPARDRDFTFDAHWALYVENYLEGLHIPFLHPALARALDLANYRYELFPWCNLQLARARDGEPAFTPPPGSPEHGERIAAYYWWVFPNLMLNFYPWGLSLNLVLPLSPERTRVIFRAFVADRSLLGAGAGAALDPVELEDEAAVQGVQRGVRSRLYPGGRYSPQHERGVHHFHRLLATALEA